MTLIERERCAESWNMVASHLEAVAKLLRDGGIDAETHQDMMGPYLTADSRTPGDNTYVAIYPGAHSFTRMLTTVRDHAGQLVTQCDLAVELRARPGDIAQATAATLKYAISIKSE